MIPQWKTIALLHPEVSTKGWAVSMMLQVAKVLQEQGNKVVFFTTKYTSRNFQNFLSIHIEVATKKNIIMKLKNFDYIIVGNSPMQFVAVTAKIIFRSHVKIFWWHHHYPWYYNSNTNFYVFLKKNLEKLCLPYIDEYITNSKYLQKSIQQVYKKDSKILYPLVDDIFLNTNKNKTNTKTILFSYGRWVEWKNIQQIFDTYEAIKKQLANVELYIAGIGDELSYFEQKYKNDTHVSFLGLLEKQDLSVYLQKARVFLFPSLIDSFWMSAAEAIVSKIPVVAFDLHGVSEIINHEKNGFLVSSWDEFIKKTYDLLVDDTLYNSMKTYMNNYESKFLDMYFRQQLWQIFEEKNNM